MRFVDDPKTDWPGWGSNGTMQTPCCFDLSGCEHIFFCISIYVIIICPVNIMKSWRLQNSGQAADVLTSIIWNPFSAEARKLFSPLDSMCLGQNLDSIIYINKYIYVYIYIRDGHQPIFIGIDILIIRVPHMG